MVEVGVSLLCMGRAAEVLQSKGEAEIIGSTRSRCKGEVAWDWGMVFACTGSKDRVEVWSIPGAGVARVPCGLPWLGLDMLH